ISEPREKGLYHEGAAKGDNQRAETVAQVTRIAHECSCRTWLTSSRLRRTDPLPSSQPRSARAVAAVIRFPRPLSQPRRGMRKWTASCATLPLAGECGQRVLMAQVLAPRLERFGSRANSFCPHG